MKTIRIANGQGFWGDSLDAPIELVRRGPIDYLTLDYLAEITMSIMQKQRARDPRSGYARDFVQMIEQILPELVERNIKVVANAGGVNPEACRDAVIEVARRAGFGGRVKIGIVAGDDIMHRLDDYIERGVELENLDTGEPLSSVRSRVAERERLFRRAADRRGARSRRADHHRGARYGHGPRAWADDSRVRLGRGRLGFAWPQGPSRATRSNAARNARAAIA